MAPLIIYWLCALVLCLAALPPPHDHDVDPSDRWIRAGLGALVILTAIGAGVALTVTAVSL